MGIYAEYLDRKMDWDALSAERKNQLRAISKIRKRPILVFASDLSKDAPIGIDYDDIVPMTDQVDNIKGKEIDILLETPGGIAEDVEDNVEKVRNRFDKVCFIIPGYAKSAGTIMVMAGDEILMEPESSALGPIDAQIIQNGKRFSAGAFLEGLDKIKQEVQEKGILNKAFIPILQNISPGEIQSCVNSLEFSKKLVTGWLSKYKFKYWENHASTGKPVKDDEKSTRAYEIADELCNHQKWLTHGRSIKLEELQGMRLKISDYSKDPALFEAIRRYMVLLRMSFGTNIFKIYETCDSQIYRFVGLPLPQVVPGVPHGELNMALVEFECPACKQVSKLQLNLRENVPLQEGVIPFPPDNIFMCPKCNARSDLIDIKRNIESQVKKKGA